MQIRKLELHGFKSFPDRTALSFGAGISGVVGPNGCGKSNVVDAVRWCLGEQRPTRLRGQAMQDVIFAGSADRGPMGSAEVTLHFSAEDEPFPGEYARLSELQVTRKLHRDGSSEYLINQQKVRLKDVQDLFLDSGAANPLYSVIEQGRIGEIVRARPEERRSLIEEAAGISRYKARRKEAEQHLESTITNLGRASDVVDNLAARLRELEKQVGKAMKYRRLSALVRQGEIFLGLSRYAAGAEDRRALTEQARDQTANERTLSRELERREAAVQAGRARLEVLDERIGRLRDRLAELEASRRELESARQYQRKEREDLRARRGNLEEQRAAAEAAAAEAAARVAAVQRERLEAERVLGEIEADLEALRAEQREVEAAARARRARIDAGKNVVMGHVRVITQAEADQRACVARREDLRQREARLGERTVDADSGLSEAKSQHLIAVEAEAAAGRRLVQVKEGVESARQGVERGEEQRAAQGRAVREAEGQLSVVEREEARLRARLDSLRALQSDNSGFEEAARAALAVPGVRGTVSDLLSVPAELDHAVTGLLGEALDAIVAPTGAVAAAVAAAVKGRVDVVVLEHAQPVQEPWLAALAVGDDGLRALGAVVSRCARVPDVAALVAASAAAQAGVLEAGAHAAVDGRGRLRLGAPGSVGAARLARKREIADLGVVVAEAEGRVTAAREAVVGARAARDAAHAAAEAAREAHEGARRLVGEAELAVREHGRQRVDLEKQVARLEGEARRVAAEAQEVEQAQLGLDQRERELAGRRAAAESAQAAAEKALLEEQSALHAEVQAADRTREAVGARAAEGAGLRERLLGLRRTEQAVATQRDTSAAQAARAAAGLEQATARIAELEADDLRLGESIAAVEGEQDGHRAQLDEDQATAKVLRDQVRADEATLGDVRSRRDEARKSLAELEQQLGQVKEQLTRIREGLEERYEISPAGLLDRLARNGHVVIEAEVGLAQAPVLDEVKKGDEDAEVEDLRVVGAMLEDAALQEAWAERLAKAKRALQRLGEVNLVALQEYKDVSERFAELDGQRADLERSVKSIRGTIARLNRLCRDRFRETFDRVDAIFQELYPRLVGGGKAQLRLTDEEDLLETGIEVYVQPPGKKAQALSLLSGGETAMVAIALIFSLFRVRPSPFCLLDEVDAPLDEANGARFNAMLSDMSALSQFIVITHNKKTMECMDTLYGVTMVQAGVSRLVTVQID
ncbi:MAG: chromosome segregation protein SMC [Deltaproteobacteria bacterium]|jgi:chromosome segregation protein|nr:chromosome segregation protein SMC [Deltaproteobacteria bacterium]